MPSYPPGILLSIGRTGEGREGQLGHAHNGTPFWRYHKTIHDSKALPKLEGTCTDSWYTTHWVSSEGSERLCAGVSLLRRVTQTRISHHDIQACTFFDVHDSWEVVKAV